jgi:DNA processing protein
MDHLPYLYALHRLPGIGSKKIEALLERFETPQAVWEAGPEDIRAALGPKVSETFLVGRKAVSPEKEWAAFERFGIQAVAFDDPDYPALLKEIPSPPLLIYKRGGFDWNSRPLVTIVGSRRCTPYGRRVAEALAQDLAMAGVCVVSGMAFGIDAAAHKGALEADGMTVAVLGNSLDGASLAPREHLSLAQAIVRQGALVSEYPPVTAANKGTFPARNRIMAGMALGTVVVEAADRSGTLITSRLALEFDREVFAVPGSVFSEASVGPHRLIRSGAKIVTGVADILEELQLQPEPFRKGQGDAALSLSPEEQKLLAVLSGEPVHIDKILKMTTLDTSTAGSTLAFLEMKGLVRNIGGMNYIKCKM